MGPMQRLPSDAKEPLCHMGRHASSSKGRRLHIYLHDQIEATCNVDGMYTCSLPWNVSQGKGAASPIISHGCKRLFAQPRTCKHCGASTPTDRLAPALLRHLSRDVEPHQRQLCAAQKRGCISKGVSSAGSRPSPPCVRTLRVTEGRAGVAYRFAQCLGELIARGIGAYTGA